MSLREALMEIPETNMNTGRRRGAQRAHINVLFVSPPAFPC